MEFKNLDTAGINEKNLLLRTISGHLHDSPRQDNFYCCRIQHWTVLYAGLGMVSSQILFYENKVWRIFVPKLYHDKRDTNFLKFLSYVRQYGPNNSRWKFPQIGRKLNEYKNPPTVSLTRAIQSTDSDWPFPQTCFKNIGLTIRGFNFFYPNLSTSLKNFFQPSQNLVNIESGTEETSNVPTQYLFYPVQQ